MPADPWLWLAIAGRFPSFTLAALLTIVALFVLAVRGRGDKPDRPHAGWD